MEKLGKTVISGKLRVLTPIHIGGAQEKHLQEGLDFIVNGQSVYVLDSTKLIQHFGIEQYSNAQSLNKLSDLIRPIKNYLEAFSNKNIKNISGEIGRDIKINIKNTLSQKPIIPGSSLKGAIRSIVYNAGGGGRNNIERDIFGRIELDIFRYMIIHDIEFNETTFINTKTYNLRNEKGNVLGGWKHNLRGQTNNQFSDRGFTFPLEVIPIEDIADFNIIINKTAFQQALKKEKVVMPNGSKDYFEGSQTDFFNALKSYSKKYLEKELNFFSKYEVEESDIISQEIEQLLKLNEASPVIRLGLGSGFHAMTGDTLHNDHLIDTIAIHYGRSRGQRNNKDSAKSRKIAFSTYNGQLKLYPMGFVQLCTNEFYETHLKNDHERRLLAMQNEVKIAEENKIKQEGAERENKEREQKKMENDKIRNAEALKPKYTDPANSTKPKLIDAIVIGKNGNNIIFNPLITGMDHMVGEIRYPAGLEKGTIIQVVCQLIKGRLIYSGSPKIKNI